MKAKIAAETYQKSLSSGIMPMMNEQEERQKQNRLHIHANISDFVTLRQVPMFEVKTQSVFPILKLLAIISSQSWPVKMVTHRFGFISDFVAFSANPKTKVSVILAWQFFIPSTNFLNNRFLQKQIHSGNAPSVVSYAAVAVFEFITNAFCPWIIFVPSFYAAADPSDLWLIQMRHKQP